MGLHKGVNIDMTAPVVLGKDEYKAAEAAISRDAITLVKYKDDGVLPITPEKYKRVMIVHIKGAPGPMDDLMAGPEAFKGTDPIDSFCGLWDAKI